ncbi:hypothetical protein [Vibrio marisflavi]|nr:hypothetical protein [Vibrio marisflavi]
MYRLSIAATIVLFALVIFLYSIEFYVQGIWGLNLAKYSAVSVLLGASTAIMVWLSNQVRQNSEDLLKESKLYYEKSYITLNVTNKDGLPKNERMRWLTAARLLKVAEKLGNQIPIKSHKMLHIEDQEYWRQKFHDLLLPNKQGPAKKYFAEDIKLLFSYTRRDPEPLDLQSILVIFEFVEWNESRLDPIPSISIPSDEKIRKMKTFGPVGLGQLLEAYKKYKTEGQK